MSTTVNHKNLLSSSYVLAYPNPLTPSVYLHFSGDGLTLTQAGPSEEKTPSSLPLKDRNLKLLSPEEAAQKVLTLGRENLAIIVKEKEAYLLPRLQGAMDRAQKPPAEQERLIREKDQYIQDLQARLQQEKFQREFDLLNQRKHHDRDLQIEALENELYSLREEQQVAREDLNLSYQERRPLVAPKPRGSSPTPFLGMKPGEPRSPVAPPPFAAQDFAQSSRQAQERPPVAPRPSLPKPLAPSAETVQKSTPQDNTPHGSTPHGSTPQGSRKKRTSVTLETLPPLDQNPLLKKKLESPHCELSLEESITLLTQCIQYGKFEAEKALEKNAVIFIGNTGAGKSTTVNYLSGCTMELKTPKELGMKGIKKLVVVRPRSQGGALDEVMPIGHTNESKTFMPQIATFQTLTYCDCPGFLDNRGAEINIANAVNVKNAISKAQSVTVIMLINYHSLLADRARGLTEMLKISCNLFGKAENLIKYKESILIGITNSPSDMELTALKEWVAEDATALMKTLAERIFIFDPLDRPLDGGWVRQELLSQIHSLKPITNQSKIFSTVLTDEDEHKLIRISEQIGQRIEQALHSKNFKQAASHFHRLQELMLIEHIAVERLITTNHQKIIHHLQNEANEFRTHCHFERFPAAEEILLQLEDSAAHFDEEDIQRFVERNSLRKYYQDSKAKHEEAKRKEEDYKRQISEAQKQIQQFLILLEEQKKTTEQQIVQQQQDFRQAMQEMEKAMQQTAEDYRAMKRRLEQEMQTRLAQKAEELQTAQGENLHEIQKKIDQERAKLNAEYQQKLQDLEKERTRVAQEQQALKDKAQKELEAEKAELQQKLAALEKSKQEKLAEQERKKLEEARLKEAQALPPIAFGKQAWEKYFGSVGQEPPLPANIHQILQEKCPIWTDKKVQDTHLLTLIPEKVDGKPLTLNSLQELVKNPKGGGNKTEYKYYWDPIKNEHGSKPSGSSYWVLMTKDVLPNTRKNPYDKQLAELNTLAARAPKVKGLGEYKTPKALEAATSILMEYVRSGTMLYDYGPPGAPATYTRCEETVTVDKTQYRVAVGGFAASGLIVSNALWDGENHGLGGLRKCFGS